MNKKIGLVIAVVCAIIIGICIGIINKNGKIEKGKSTESIAKMNIVENNTISTNKVEETVNYTVDDENITIVNEINNSDEDTNITTSNENNTNNRETVTSDNINVKDNTSKESSKETTDANISNENTNFNLLNEPTPDLSGQVSVVPYAMTEDEIEEVNNGNSHTFIGTVTNINDVAVFIKPDEGYEGGSGNQITLVKSEYGAGLEMNYRVEITFIGEVTKTYPGNIHVVALKILNR